jgi:hypothetical protein
MLLQIPLFCLFASLYASQVSDIHETFISALESRPSSDLKTLKLKFAWNYFTTTIDQDGVNLSTLQRFLVQGIHPNTALTALLSNIDDNIEAIEVCAQYGADIRDVFFESLPNTITLKRLERALSDLAPFLDRPWLKRTLYSCLFRVAEEDMAGAVRIISRYEPFAPAAYEIRSLLGHPYDDFSVSHVRTRCDCIGAFLDAGLPVSNTMIAFKLVHGCKHHGLRGVRPQPSTDRFWFDIVRPLYDVAGIDGIKAYIRASRALGAPLSSPVTGHNGTFKSVLPAVVRFFPQSAHIPILSLLLEADDCEEEGCGMQWSKQGLDQIAYEDEQITYRSLLAIARLYDSPDEIIE